MLNEQQSCLSEAQPRTLIRKILMCTQKVGYGVFVLAMLVGVFDLASEIVGEMISVVRILTAT